MKGGNYFCVASRFFLRLPNGLGAALLGTVRTFLTASRNRVNASGPSTISRVAGFMGSS